MLAGTNMFWARLMAFRCGQNIQIAKCYSKNKKLVEMYKYDAENYNL